MLNFENYFFYWGKEETTEKEAFNKDETKENSAVDVVSQNIMPLKIVTGWPKRAEMTVIYLHFKERKTKL